MYIYIKAFDGHQTVSGEGHRDGQLHQLTDLIHSMRAQSKIECIVRVTTSHKQAETVDVRIDRFRKPISWHPFQGAGINRLPAAAKPMDTAFITPSPPAKTTTTRKPRLPPVNRLNNGNATQTSSPPPPSSLGKVNKATAGEQQPQESMAINQMLVLNVAGVAVVFAFVVLLITYRCRSSVRTPRNVLKSFSHKIINNNKLDSVETIASYDRDFKNVLFHTRSGSSDASEVDDAFEMPRRHVRLIHVLDEGNFGQVWKGEVTMTPGSHSVGCVQVVAVKMLKENTTEKEKKDLMDELKLMKRLDPHPNVVRLLGCVSDREPVLLVMEYVPFGKLQSYLRNCRADNNEYNGIYNREKLTSRDLVSFAYQVARGMEYLSSKGVSNCGKV